MDNNLDNMEQEIAAARRKLAGTLDQLTDRLSPETLANQASESAIKFLQRPEVQQVLAGIGALVAVGIVASVWRAKQRKKEYKELRALFAREELQ